MTLISETITDLHGEGLDRPCANHASLTVQQKEAIGTVISAVAKANTEGIPTHLGLEACAGSGKTSTLVAMIEQLHETQPEARILVLAFNVDAVTQLRNRLPPSQSGLVTDVFTLHSYGMHLLSASSLDNPIQFDQDKALSKWKSVSGHNGIGMAFVTEWRRVRNYIDTTRHTGIVPTFHERPLTLDDTVMQSMIDDHTTVDQDDQIYQCLVQQLKITSSDTYDLVLVDEAQDLNMANISFLRSIVAPLGTKTVVCAVGDPAQAIYAFRGASPEALQCYGSVFHAKWMSLTCCFRCPRRIVFLASHLCPTIIHEKGASLGCVSVITTAQPWQALVDKVSKLQMNGKKNTLFLARNNRTILEALGHVYHTADRMSGIHWLSPGIARELRNLVWNETNISFGDLLKMATVAVEQHIVTATDRVMHLILEMAVRFEGVQSNPSTSAWLQWLVQVLEEDRVGDRNNMLTVATIHAVKGEEWPHVVIHDFNLFGQYEDDSHANQDRNLLYIAITRAQQSLTFLQTKRTTHIRSQLLPIDIVHYAKELWEQ